MNISDDRLTPEERELARLLGRPGASAGPDARLDAAILAMARAPQAAPQATPQPSRTARSGSWGRRRRVFSSLTAAASLVLVVGLAWQLRPVTPPPPMLNEAAYEAPAADAPDVSGSNAPIAEPAVDAEAMAAPPAVAPPAAPAPAAVTKVAKPQPQAVVIQSAPAPAPPVIASDIATGQGTPEARDNASVAPLAAPAPAYAPAPPAPAAAAAYEEINRNAQAKASAPQFKQAPATATESRERRLQLRTGPASTANDMAMLSDTVASDIDTDATLSRHKWLQKIRQRHNSGDVEGARASLHRFVQDYPEARIPRDLRPLLKD